MKKIILAMSVALSLTACSTQTALINGQGGAAPKEEMQTFFVSGLGQTQTLDAAAMCGGANKVVKVERQVSFLNGILGILTGGVYTPIDARVYCRA